MTIVKAKSYKEAKKKLPNMCIIIELNNIGSNQWKGFESPEAFTQWQNKGNVLKSYQGEE
jgi:hypothetical protein